MNRAPVAVVIGAGDATGSAVAKRFAREGFTLCVTRRTVEKLETLVSDIEAAGGVVKPFGCDARVEQEMVELFAHIEKDIGPIEVVVFNIGANVH
ncbi:MAG: SDR family NAD(P)-dependent oxidoreductase, partial [Psychrobacter sp.]